MATRYRLRLYLLALLILGGFSVLVARLHSVQILEHEAYVNRLPGMKYESIRIPGIRGEIKDRNGIVLAKSLPSFEVRFDLKAIVEDYKREHKNRVPKREWTRYKRGQPVVEDETDIVQIVNQAVIPSLGNLGLAENYNADQMRVHYRSTGGVVPFTYRRDLTFEEFAKFAEHNLALPGVTVTVSGRRQYAYDSLACHILGYVNLPDIDKVPAEEKQKFNYYVGDDYGASGVEMTMDHYLQGVPGKRVMKKDEKGKFIGIESETAPEAGADVYLTIDARIQLVTEQALRKIGRGAAVVMDPRTGEVLAMASVPSYNPNIFIPNVSTDAWQAINEDLSAPMLNRAMMPFPPGSTCKIPVALAGCLSDSWRHRFVCGAGAQYGNKFMKCWCAEKGYTHGSPNLSEAIKYSCNGFFYRYANDTGIRNILTMTNLLGLGRQTGIKITGEQPGTIPSPEWLRMKGLVWSDAYTAMTGIGQGFTEATPLQMASVTCTVANGGRVYQPSIVHQVKRQDGEIVWKEDAQPRHELTKEGLTGDQIEMVKKGMWRVVNDPGGTAGRAASELTVLSGKTGTAQTGNLKQPTNAWFICFAPYDEPEIAVCVFVENGKSGGGAASPIAKNIIENTVAMQKGKEIALAPIEPAKGHFGRIESVSFDGTDLVAYAADEEADSGVDVGEFVPSQLRTREVRPMPGYTQPSIRKRADSDGSVSNRNVQSTRRFRPLELLFGGKRKR
ncbi:MAG: penicillin-binding protein 2 [Verrucomicrobiae bacterium]|nr:penicillin-binding protein 2 [Verrucomicrobiae bacterium]